MANFVYLIGCPRTKEVAVVDPAWEVDRIARIAQADGMKITKILITHTHFDHINGVEELLQRTDAQVFVHKTEVEDLPGATANLRQLESGDVIQVGDVKLTTVHTPGHTRGSQCFLVSGALLSGDTLFIGSCGRVDLPGSDPKSMFESLGQLKRLNDHTVVYPGHDYGDTPHAPLADQKRRNPYLLIQSIQDFLHFLGHGTRPVL
ncbi:MAG: MBL fold metallo-hydrolase [Elusimicrobia bacterium]|nr:MBL fold metallo-hydrolase [Elusimicrobiota bacterium]